MRKSIFLAGLALIALLAGCSDDDLNNEGGVRNPVQTGDEILFGSKLSGDADVIESGALTRTVYGDRTETGVPVYWDENGDSIAIFCLQASQPADHLVNYQVLPEMDVNGKPTATAASVTKDETEKAGLQWGDPNEEHRFYAFYPASAVKGSEEENETGKITANIPVTQQVQEWRKGKFESSDKELDGRTCYFGLPNMDYAYMYAYNAVTPSQVQDGSLINLHFKNLVTVLDITIQGPETGSVVVTNVNVDAIGDNKDIILTGDFTCNIRAAKNEETGVDEITATCDPVESNEVRNRISIPCYAKNQEDDVSKGFITLNAGELLNVKAYIIPQDANNTVTQRTLRITVATLNGAANVRTLDQTDIIPHKINRVLLPKLKPGGTNYWLSNLDSNIYLSELSLPGSKMSFSTTGNDGTEKFQTQSLETQFMDGVRAFVVQTEANTTYDRTYNWQTGYTYNVTDATVNEKYTKESLETILGQLNTLLNEAKSNNKMNEFAFVQITYDAASYTGDNPGGGAYRYWIEGIEYELNQLIQNGNPYNIYTDQITPDTKLGDVGGHIVLKVNFNDGQTGMGQYIDADATIPALFSTWTKGMDDVALYWGSPNSNQTGRPEMHWYYSEATHIGNSNEAADLATKKNQISKVFQESVDKYIHGTGHNYWFMNDIGGCYSKGNPTIPTLTADLNNYAVQLLQERTQNASLGIVLLNYADKQADSGAKYQSDWLIQTIIDNNFKFALRKASDTTNNTTNSDASYISGGSVIK